MQTETTVPHLENGGRYVPNDADLAEIERQFTYHSPKGNQPERYVEIRDAGKALALAILRCVPRCADRTAAIRKVREAIMTANAGIATTE